MTGEVVPANPAASVRGTRHVVMPGARAGLTCAPASANAIMTAIGDRKANRWHLQITERWVVQYNFYVNDDRWGRMFVRVCPYLPFSARVCLNQHHWLANRMCEQGLDFQQCSNAFLRCATPKRLHELADTLTAEDLSSCGQKWLTRHCQVEPFRPR